MKTSINWYSQIILLSLPLIVMLLLVLLAKSSLFLYNPQAFSNAITLDLIFTMPLFYFFLIRKTDIRKSSVSSIFVIGIAVATFAIPTAHQSLLQHIKTIIFPIVEMGVLGYVAFNTYKTWKRFRAEKNANTDFYSALSIACKEVLPPKIAALFTTEIAVMYYSFFRWKKRDLTSNEFTYYKKSGIRLLIATFIFLIFIETFALHLILQLWSHTLAWVLTALSLYVCLQVFALLKSMTQRPILIDMEGGKLFLRYGFFSETTISLKDIQRIEANTKPLPVDKSILQFSPLGNLDKHNIILHLASEHTLQRIYGIEKQYQSLAIYVDEKETFLAMLN